MPRGLKRANATSYGSERGNTPVPNHEGGAQPKAFRTRMALIASRAKTVKRMEAALDSDDDNVFLKAFKECADRGFGAATQKVEVSGDTALLSATEREARLMTLLEAASARKTHGK